MENQTKPNSFKKLLDRLQEDSWQLELLVSGFTIFGLFSAIEPMLKFSRNAFINGDKLTQAVSQSTILAIYILIFNLILHLTIRSLWIGALGLRYVSGDIEVEKLNYTHKFTKHLKKRLGSFDNYIKKLEEFSSVIFAISFLLIFYVIAFFTSFYTLSFVGQFSSAEYSVITRTIVGVLKTLLLLGAILTFFDFITLGLLKKYKWTSIIYFPFYKLFSIITLSFLYRPLSYNLLDNKFGRRISILLVPFYLFILIISTLYIKKSNYINQNLTITSNSIIAKSRNYEDLVHEDKDFIDGVAIQSKVITDSYIKVVVPIDKKIDDKIFNFNKGLQPEKDNRGYKTSIKISFNNNKDMALKRKMDSLQNEYLKTFNKIYSIKIDSTTYQSDFIITNRNNEKLGFESYIGIKNLSEGKHTLSFQKLKHPKTDSLVVIKKIPFWYFKN